MACYFANIMDLFILSWYFNIYSIMDLPGLDSHFGSNLPVLDGHILPDYSTLPSEFEKFSTFYKTF